MGKGGWKKWGGAGGVWVNRRVEPGAGQEAGSRAEPPPTPRLLVQPTNHTHQRSVIIIHEQLVVWCPSGLPPHTP
jgi:hypothetical protein